MTPEEDVLTREIEMEPVRVEGGSEDVLEARVNATDTGTLPVTISDCDHAPPEYLLSG